MEFANALIERFYRNDPELRMLLLTHSMQVRDKAMDIAETVDMELDWDLLNRGALLHDIGIIKCHAPDIHCHGKLPYIAHGTAGAEMLREVSGELEGCARICMRHTGSGLTAQEIAAGKLPLPEMDLLPETPEEKLICLADKFFSKSGKMEEKPLRQIRRSMEKFGPDSLARFDELCRIFNIPV